MGVMMGGEGIDIGKGERGQRKGDSRSLGRLAIVESGRMSFDF